MFKIIQGGDNGPTIKLTRGDYCTFQIGMTDAAGDPYTLQDGDTLYFTIKRNTKTEEIVFQQSFTYGDTTAVEIENADTASERYGTYKYDCCLVKPGERPDTFLGPSDFILTEEVTF